MQFSHFPVEHSDSRFESIRFPTNRNVRFDCTWLLASVCQTTYRRITAADTTVTITTHERVRVITHHSSVSSVTAQTRSCILTSLFNRNGRAYATVLRLSVCLSSSVCDVMHCG